METNTATPLTDEEYEARLAVCEPIIEHYKKELSSLLGARAGRDLVKYANEQLKDREKFTDMSIEAFTPFADALCRAIFSNKVRAAVKFTPDCYKKKWSVEKRAALENFSIPERI